MYQVFYCMDDGQGGYTNVKDMGLNPWLPPKDEKPRRLIRKAKRGYFVWIPAENVTGAIRLPAL